MAYKIKEYTGQKFDIGKYGGYISFFDKLFIGVYVRGGKMFIAHLGCSICPPIYLCNPPFIHVQNIYVQIGRLSIEVAWKSDKCYEVINKGEEN